jgi:methionyl aminopeptidase
VGHGVGRILHEEPQIPGYIKMDIEDTPVIRKGMTLAIEVIYGQGTGTVVYDNNDGWTIATKDRSVSAVFEHSIAVTADEPLILTKI